MKNRFNFTLQDIFFFLILILLTVAFFNILKPFIGDAFLALILVILFKRPFRWFRKKFKDNTKKAAAVTLVMVVVVIIIPVSLIGLIVANEVGQNYTELEKQWPSIKEELTEEKIKEQFDGVPYIGDYVQEIEWEDIEQRIDEIVSTLTEFAVQLLQNTFKGVVYFIIHVFILLFFLYFMFADGDFLIKRLQYLIPLKDDDERELMANMEKVTDGIVINSFMLGMIEGIYGGVLFAILGVPSPAFWGVIMAGLSIIPLVGTNSVLVPAAIIYFLIGDYTTGVLILTVGTGVILINQNLIRPKLDAKRSGMHTAMALIASLGGLIWLGVIGFLAGPLLTGLFLVIWDQFGKKYQTNLESLNKGE
jgi:predicted PurR-regulated permease PerM